MDGFEESSGVIVMAATNKIEVLDEALLRSGRFDRHIHIPMPDFADRVEILKIYLKGKNIAMDIEDIAKITVGFSGASLATLINEAAIHSLRRNSVIIEEEDIYEARQ
jgi:ATP-dependent Zn protease